MAKTIEGLGSKLTVRAMEYNGKNVARKVFDLNDHRGERVRVHIDVDGKFTIETKPEQKLLVCELDVPKREYEHIEKTVDGEPVVESKEKELELERLTMKEYLKGDERKK